MSIDPRIAHLVEHVLTEVDLEKKYLNPKTGNHVGYFRAMQLGLIKPVQRVGKSIGVAPHKTTKTKVKIDKGPKPVKEKQWWHDLTQFKLNAYPVNIPENKVKVNFTGDINSHAVLQWTNPVTGKVVRSYTREFLKRNADIKWKRILKIKPSDITHIKKTVDKVLVNPYDDKVKQAAAIIGIIANTGLRIGSEKGLAETGNKGVSTLSADNIKISGDTIKLNFVGKSYQDNEATIVDKHLATYLQAKILERQTEPTLFTVSKSQIDQAYDELMGMEDFKIKDLRTYVATETAKAILYQDPMGPPPLPANPKEIKNAVKEKLKNVFERVSEILNNTPAMARTSYVHPKIVYSWLKSIGVKAEVVGYSEAVFREAEIEDTDAFDDVDFYALPDWWDSDDIQLVPIA
jgi:hypothetical protein